MKLSILSESWIRKNPIKRGQYNIKRVKLDFDKLYGKAFKITEPSGVKGNGASVVTPFNTNAWTDWPEKQSMIQVMKNNDMLNDPESLDDEKYMQIYTAAKKLKLI